MHTAILFAALPACFAPGECDPQGIDLALEVESTAVPVTAAEVELDLALAGVHDEHEAMWIAGVAWDPRALRFEGFRYPDGFSPVPLHRHFLGPPMAEVEASTWENPGWGAVDFRARVFNPPLHRPKDGRSVLARLLFSVVAPRPTEVRVLVGTPRDSQGQSWPTAVWFCGGWRTFLPEDSRPMRPGAVTFIEPFTRGDVDRNGEVRLADALAILDALFLGDGPLPCAAAADVDLDRRVTITDAVYLVTHLFLSGRAPAPPYPLAGFAADGGGCPAGGE